MASLANDDTKENEVVAAEDRAKSRDAAYKQSVQTYKSSRDRARALMARLNDEELALRDAATAWVDEFCAVGAPAREPSTAAATPRVLERTDRWEWVAAPPQLPRG